MREAVADESCVIRGDYVDLKLIKTRSAAQIHIEIPIEQFSEFVQRFGGPMPGKGVPVVLARIVPTVTVEPDTGVPDIAIDSNGTARLVNPPKPKGGELSKQAAMACHDGAFWKFLDTLNIHPDMITDADMAADAVRAHCDVQSRSELDHKPEAAQYWRDLYRSYQAWLIDDHAA